MDRDVALAIKDALEAIQTAVETIAENTTPTPEPEPEPGAET